MARGSEVRGRMVEAGQDLLSRRGYGMTMLDVVDKAIAPRGSIYYHFPSGKEELAIQVAAKTAIELEGLIKSLARKHRRPARFLQALVDHHKKRLVSAGLEAGCPLMGITVSMDIDSADLKGAVADSFARWIGAIATVLRDQGVDDVTSDWLAAATVAGIEGAIVIARGTRDAKPLEQFQNLIPVLVKGIAAP